MRYDMYEKELHPFRGVKRPREPPSGSGRAVGGAGRRGAGSAAYRLSALPVCRRVP